MHDNWDDMDLRMRSLLEDAEVKAPRGVWRAVSSTLDARAASRPAAAWWGWGAALAAAVLAAALVIPTSLRRGSSDSVPADPIALVTPVQPIENTVQSGPAETSDFLAESAAPAAAPNAGKAPGFVPFVRTVAEDADNAPAEEPSATGQVQEAAPAPQAESSDVGPEAATSSNAAAPVKPAPMPGAPSAAYSTSDYWASLEDDAPAQRRAATLFASGFVCTNDSGFAANHGRSLMSPAYGKPQNLDGLTETSASTYGIPVTFNLGVAFPLTQKFSLGTGLSYSLLTRTFTGEYIEGGVSTKGDVSHQMQYLGIPLNLYCDIVNRDSGSLRVYTYVGGEVSHAVSNNYLIRTTMQRISKPVDRFQFSLAAGLGVECPLAGHLGIFLDPGVRYYFYNGQPKSLRTEKPFMVSFDAGLRIKL